VTFNEFYLENKYSIWRVFLYSKLMFYTVDINLIFSSLLVHMLFLSWRKY